jgi:hypothetical protein
MPGPEENKEGTQWDSHRKNSEGQRWGENICCTDGLQLVHTLFLSKKKY